MKLSISENKVELGQKAAKLIADKINQAIAEKGEARIVLSTGASQFETLDALVKENVDWSKVTMFHLDEYVNLPITHIASFRKYLHERFVDIVHPGKAYFVNGEGDVQANIAELTEKLREKPLDIGVIGIGENGHIAFNDPPVADFCDTRVVKPVELDDICRQQQVNDGCFKTFDDVPKTAITLTVPTLFAGKHLFCIVPAKTKANAVRATLNDDINEACPATILRRHPSATLYLDADSSALL